MAARFFVAAAVVRDGAAALLAAVFFGVVLDAALGAARFDVAFLGADFGVDAFAGSGFGVVVLVLAVFVVPLDRARDPALVRPSAARVVPALLDRVVLAAMIRASLPV